MLKPARTITSLVAAGALLAAPAAAVATKGDHSGKSHKNKSANSCAKTHMKGFVVAGTLVSAVADDPTTAASEATVTLTVTGANRHARHSGELADQDATKPGVQVKGATYTVAAGDAFRLKLRGYEGTDTPSAGDRVKVIGRIAVTKKRCAPAGTSVADRYGAVDVRRVSIKDRDPDA
ncbi:MAG: hypothetical protein ACRDMZ_08005 [Solirubrobacteraceae bacterium]